MITDAIKKEALESLLAELEEREVDSMGDESPAADDACPYCGKPTIEPNPACSMHGLHEKAKPAATHERSVMKIKIGGKSPKKEEVY